MMQLKSTPNTTTTNSNQLRLNELRFHIPLDTKMSLQTVTKPKCAQTKITNC